MKKGIQLSSSVHIRGNVMNNAYRLQLQWIDGIRSIEDFLNIAEQRNVSVVPSAHSLLRSVVWEDCLQGYELLIQRAVDFAKDSKHLVFNYQGLVSLAAKKDCSICPLGVGPMLSLQADKLPPATSWYVFPYIAEGKQEEMFQIQKDECGRVILKTKRQVPLGAIKADKLCVFLTIS